MKASTECEYRERVACVVETLIANPAGQHTLQEMAEKAHLSPFHFQRVYTALVGESPSSTVRRLRLAEAAQQLASSDISITAIALDAGYESSQTFARAFRNFSCMTPGVFRNVHRTLVTQRISKRDDALIRLVEQPQFEVVSVPHDGPVLTIPLAFRSLQSWHNRQPDVRRVPPVGLIFHDQDRLGKIRYFAGLRVRSRAPLKGPMHTQRVGGGLYAAFRLIGPYALIAPTFRTLIERWLPQSGFHMDHRPALELYKSGVDSSAGKAPITELLLPIT